MLPSTYGYILYMKTGGKMKESHRVVQELSSHSVLFEQYFKVNPFQRELPSKIQN